MATVAGFLLSANTSIQDNSIANLTNQSDICYSLGEAFLEGAHTLAGYKRFVQACYELALALIVVNSILPVFSILGNTVVILTVALVQELQVPANLLLSSLAVTDLLTGLVVQPAHVHALYVALTSSNPVICHLKARIILDVCGYISITSSVSTLCLMTLDRYIAIVYPLRYVTSVTITRTTVAMGLSWVFSSMFSFFCIFATPFLPGVMILWFLYVVVASIFMVCLQLRIFNISHRESNAIKSEIKRFHPGMKTKMERKALKTVSIITLFLILSFIPIAILKTALQAKGGGSRNNSFEIMSQIFTTFLLMSPSLHPFIYFMRSSKLRKTFIKLVKDAVRRIKQQ